MEGSMSATQFLTFLVLCMILGAAGQVGRVVVGLKKLRDQTNAQGTDFNESFEVSRLVVSLIIGGVAGIIAGLALKSGDVSANAYDTKFAVGIMAAGYAGADFIEGFISKNVTTAEVPGQTAKGVAYNPADVPPVG
jgi:putative chitinase